MGIGRKWVDRSIERLLGAIAPSSYANTQDKQDKAEAAEKAKIATAQAAEQEKIAKVSESTQGPTKMASNRAVKKKPSGKMENNLAKKKFQVQR